MYRLIITKVKGTFLREHSSLTFTLVITKVKGTFFGMSES